LWRNVMTKAKKLKRTTKGKRAKRAESSKKSERAMTYESTTKTEHIKISGLEAAIPDGPMSFSTSLPPLTHAKRMYDPRDVEAVTILGLGRSIMSYVAKMHSGDIMENERNPRHEVWTINWGAFLYKHDVCWEMHDFSTEPDLLDPIQRRRFAELPTPIVTVKAFNEIENTFEYPIVDIVNFFNDNYFSNCVAYQIAMAVMIGVKQISLYGCDYNYKVPGGAQSPYEHGRSCVEYWLKEAIRRDIVVIVPKETMLMDMYQRVHEGQQLYGYSEFPTFYAEDDKLQAKWEEEPQFDDVAAMIDAAQAAKESRSEKFTRLNESDNLSVDIVEEMGGMTRGGTPLQNSILEGK
jgi:hypothetical protein